jgi:predicted phage terminase large subunit-like protein
MIIMPPQHGKSELTSAAFPAWYLGSEPEHRVLFGSYEAKFAATWGEKARDIFAEHAPSLFGYSVRERAASTSRWNIKGHRGGMSTAGVGGSFTGKGADLFIVDDPIKNDEQAFSQTYRDSLWNWYRSTVLTRLSKNASVILIQTRWHEDDLAGRLLAAAAKGEGDQWEVIHLPALAQEDDELGRKPGEALCPALHDEEQLLGLHRAMGSYWFSAMYQGEPAPAEGGTFKRAWLRYFDINGTFYEFERDGIKRRVSRDSCITIQVLDLATSMKERADFFALMTIAVTQTKEMLLLDVFNGKLEAPDQRSFMSEMNRKWRPSKIGIESNGYQLGFVQEMVRAGYPAVAVLADKDIMARALPLAARYESQQVFHRLGAAYVEEYESQLLHFPAGHDDMVSAGAIAARWMADGFGQTAVISISKRAPRYGV